jgi:hypothetical protein
LTSGNNRRGVVCRQGEGAPSVVGRHQ